MGHVHPQASVDVADVAATRAALAQTMAELAARPVEADVFTRARAPMLERVDNALKGNGGWLSLPCARNRSPTASRGSRRARAAAGADPGRHAGCGPPLPGPGAVTVLVLPQGGTAQRAPRIGAAKLALRARGA
jgi:zinc protease